MQTHSRHATRVRGVQRRTDDVEFVGATGLLEPLREPLRRALQGRQTCYHVDVDAIGRCGEVVVVITGSKGRLPLLFGREELEPGYVMQVVRDTVDRFGF